MSGNTRRRRPVIQQNSIDRIVAFFSPVRARRRYIARAQLAMAESYVGASTSRRQTKAWSPTGSDADSDTLYDLPTLRARSRDLIRNDPLAAGAILTKVSHVVGSGLKLQSRIDRDVLGMSQDEADEWEALAEREWALWWGSKNCDATLTRKGPALTRMIYRQVLENGDVFLHLPRIRRSDSPYTLAIQTIEADRVCNKDNSPDTEYLAGGILRDDYGAPREYHILRRHPGGFRFASPKEWTTVAARSSLTGLPNILHLANLTRPGQSRGIPDLSPVIEPLKMLSRYTEAELMAAVVSGLFAVFIRTEAGEADINLEDLEGETKGTASDEDLKLTPGALIGLAPGEQVDSVNPGRPNAAYDPFTTSILRQIGVALGLPFELLIKHFTSSYSAARAALNEAWEYFSTERDWLASELLQTVYGVWMYESVALGRLYAPGYFDDPLAQRAYQSAEWTGPARKMLDETKEVAAAEKRIEIGISTRSLEAASITGQDFEKNVAQLGKEKALMQKAGIWSDGKKQAQPQPQPTNKQDEEDE